MTDPRQRVTGDSSDLNIDQFNQWMRAQPWYAQQMQQWGQDPAHPNTTEDQGKILLKLAQANGAQIDEGNLKIDDHGNVRQQGTDWGTVAKIAGGVGLAVTGLGAAGIGPMAGLFGGGAAAAGAAGAGGVGLGETGAVTGLAGSGFGLGGAAAGAGAGGGLLGGLSKALPFVADLGPKFGALAKGRAQGRAAEALQQQAQDRLRMQAAEFNRGNPAARAHDAARGDVLANVQDYQLSGEGRNLSGSGGLRPSLLSPGTRSLGSSMSRQAMMSQLGSTGEGAPPPGMDPYAQMTPTPLPQPGGVDTALTGAGLTGDILPSLLPFFRKKPPVEENPYLGNYT